MVKGLASIAHNKRLQLDNLRGVDFAVSLSLNYTAKSSPHKLRLKRALNIPAGAGVLQGLTTIDQLTFHVLTQGGNTIHGKHGPFSTTKHHSLL